MSSKKGTHKSLAQNRKARHDYFVEQAFEAGLCLCGTEVKSVRLGQVNLKESYAAFEPDGLYVVGMRVSPYENGNMQNRDPLRKKKLLLHKSELFRLRIQVQQKGFTLIPLSLYLKEGLVKLELGVCRGKKLYDKRADEAKRDASRETARAIRGEKF